MNIYSYSSYHRKVLKTIGNTHLGLARSRWRRGVSLSRHLVDLCLICTSSFCKQTLKYIPCVYLPSLQYIFFPNSEFPESILAEIDFVPNYYIHLVYECAHFLNTSQRQKSKIKREKLTVLGSNIYKTITN